MLTPKDVVLLEYSGLPEGETINGELCPKCRGGVSREGTLSVSRQDGSLLWICYRSSCGFKGGERSVGTSSVSRTTPCDAKAATGRRIVRESGSLPDGIAEMLSNRYGISTQLRARVGFGWSHNDDRLTMPVRSYEGGELGVVLRALDGRSPKVISYTEKGACAWYKNPTTKGVIVVEDQLSAVRASVYMTSLALLGTDLSQKKVVEIIKTRQAPVFLALDNDAISKAIIYVTQYRAQIPIQLVRLNKDIKDMTHEESDDLFSSIGYLPSM